MAKDTFQLQRITPPEIGVLPMVLDTDTYNEVDDQFALAYALLSPERLKVEAIYAAPFLNARAATAGEGMEKSYQEILRLMALIPGGEAVPVFRGAQAFMDPRKQPMESDAVHDLIARGMARDDNDPLYVVAIGAITNVASALLLEPRLAEKIVVLWLGGNPTYWDYAREFNLWEDVPAAQVVLGSGVPLVLCPCLGVASHLLTTPADLREHLSGKNALCDALVTLFCEYNTDHFAWAKVVWDLLPIAWLINAKTAPSRLLPTPVLSQEGNWSMDSRRPLMREITYVNRNAVFADLFRKLTSFS